MGATHDEMSKASYRALLERTAGLYPLFGFDVLAQPELPARMCILRHDIDFSPASAVQLAEVEASCGIGSTYMVLLTGPQYSPFEAPTRALLLRIAELGHEIGLHFDAASHGIEDEAALTSAVSHEADIVNRLLGLDVRCFSFHNTTEFTMSAQADQYGGLWNAYSGRLQRQLAYVSDSNGYWRFKTWNDLLELAPDRLQVLTHPEWWTEPGSSPGEKISRIMDRRTRAGWTDYIALLQGGGREVRTDLPEVEAHLLGSEEGRSLLIDWSAGDRETAYLSVVKRLGRQGIPLLQEQRQLAVDLLSGAQVSDQRLRDAFVAAVRAWRGTAG
jgi:hypothetical protein